VALGLGQRHLHDAIVHKHLHACTHAQTLAHQR
jgi:hypothetical protein